MLYCGNVLPSHKSFVFYSVLVFNAYGVGTCECVCVHACVLRCVCMLCVCVCVCVCVCENRETTFFTNTFSQTISSLRSDLGTFSTKHSVTAHY